jgi:hypothetical protein
MDRVDMVDRVDLVDREEAGESKQQPCTDEFP